MNNYIRAGFGIAAFAALAGSAAATEHSVETRALDARVVRVKLDGVVTLRIRQGAVPHLVISGEKDLVARTTTVQSGDTLSIDSEVDGFHFGPRHGLQAELTLPQLREVVSESLGSTVVSGFSGDELDIGLDGAGSMKIACNYKIVTASLGGIGSMHIQSVGEGIDLNLHGAGLVTVSGKSKWLKANLGGLGGLDAQQLDAQDVSIDLSGFGNANVTAHQSANLSLSGLGSVTVNGKPVNRKVSVEGLGKVSWK